MHEQGHHIAFSISFRGEEIRDLISEFVTVAKCPSSSRVGIDESVFRVAEFPDVFLELVTNRNVPSKISSKSILNFEKGKDTSEKRKRKSSVALQINAKGKLNSLDIPWKSQYRNFEKSIIKQGHD